MRVQVDLSASQDIDGLKSLVEQWETQFPMGKLSGVSAYGTLHLLLDMPPATQVIPPQIVDARGMTEEA